MARSIKPVQGVFERYSVPWRVKRSGVRGDLGGFSSPLIIPQPKDLFKASSPPSPFSGPGASKAWGGAGAFAFPTSRDPILMARIENEAKKTEQERQAIYAQAAENDRRRAAGREEMLQKNMAARESQGQQALNPLQFLQPLLKILGMIF